VETVGPELSIVTALISGKVELAPLPQVSSLYAMKYAL
jgi:hypothetical protein